MSDARQQMGLSGEERACRELVGRGYAILERRYRLRHGEIDIIARDGVVLVFVEVKTRHGAEYGGGAEAITRLKRRRMTRVAEAYLARQGLVDVPCRFDVVVVSLGGPGPAIELFQNAFDAE